MKRSHNHNSSSAEIWGVTSIINTPFVASGGENTYKIIIYKGLDDTEVKGKCLA